ncbi:MAG: alanine:cation symporter family protein [Phycisphaerales bacterium]|nr:alanine:cation symporter family protein [Phycisphaerales bacterium]
MYLFGPKSVMIYRIVYCVLIVFACVPQFIKTENELDIVSTLGTGVMLWANIPIMLIFGPMAMKAYREYMGKLKRGEFHPHAAPRIVDVVDGSDVE